MKKKYFDFAETCFVILGILFFSGSLGSLFRPESPFHSLVSLTSLVRWFLAIGSLPLVVIRFPALLRKAKQNLWLIALIALGLISSFWSPFPDYSFGRIRSEFFPMTIFGLYFGASFSIRDQVRLLSYGLILNLVFSWLLALGLPSIGRDLNLHTGSWVGVYGHRNTASTFMILTALVTLLLSFRHTLSRWLFVNKSILLRLLGISALVFILLTQSGTGLVLSLLLSLSLYFYSKFKWRGKITIFLTIIAAYIILPISIYILYNWQQIVLGLGRDPTLTGRTLMWDVAIQKVLMHPFLGYGIGGFWAPGSSNPIEVARSVAFIGFTSDHIHNGYLDLAIDLGFIGVSLFFVSLTITLKKALKQAYLLYEPEDLYPLGFLILFMINNITESYILYRTQMFWPLYIAIALNVGCHYYPRSISAMTRKAEHSSSSPRRALGQPV